MLGATESIGLRSSLEQTLSCCESGWSISPAVRWRRNCEATRYSRHGRQEKATGGSTVTGHASYGTNRALTGSAREVVLGADPPVKLTRRAQRVLAELRDSLLHTVHPGGTVITQRERDVRWWTWAGFRANATLAATLGSLADEKQSFVDEWVRLRADVDREMWSAAVADATERLCLPEVDEQALVGLKFSEALPHRLAVATLAARLADLEGAAAVLGEPVRFLVRPG